VHTQTGMFIGTPQYISPEHARGASGEQLDGRADIYSVGIVLYEMLTGSPPFKGVDPREILKQHMDTTPARPQAVRPDIHFPEVLVQVVRRALSKDPAARYATAEDMIAALLQAKSAPRPAAIDKKSDSFRRLAPNTEPRRVDRPRSDSASLPPFH